MAEVFEFRVGAASSAARHYAATAPRGSLVLGHGAGSTQDHPWMVGMASEIARRGVDVITFDFLYSHTGRRIPDKNALLEETFVAIVAAARTRFETARAALWIGGKSMGGRIATQVAAQDAAGAIRGLILLGYPLHPPGQPKKLRSAHLPDVRAPMLFVQGSRDAFGRPEELDPIVASLSQGSRLMAIEGGDHSLNVPKRQGDAAAVTARVAKAITEFCHDSQAVTE